MALFFLVIGLEIKREVLVGELDSVRRAVLPVAAAVGGALVPALIYVLLVGLGSPATRGWGVPMATDIAFALGVLALMGRWAPLGLRIFLTALAIVDDLLAVVVIAVFYTDDFNVVALAAVGVVLARPGRDEPARHPSPGRVRDPGRGALVRRLPDGDPPDDRRGAAGAHDPRPHAPRRAAYVRRAGAQLREVAARFRDEAGIEERDAALWELEDITQGAQAPMLRMEHGLHPWVAFAIVPLFALANAGVRIPQDVGAAMAQPVVIGIVVGLVLGKQLGISAAAWLVVRSGFASLPDGVAWRHMYGAAWLGGIGFTMSLFVAELAFPDPALEDAAKLGILLASVIAGLGGFVVLFLADRRSRPWRPDVDVYVAGGIFLVAYALIASERFDRTLVALLGAMLVIVLGVVDQQEAFAAIDFNVIFLLVGMMIMAGALRKTGFFEYVAGHAIRLSEGKPFRLLVSLTVFTAILSAFLDNVTTVVLLTPITLAITRTIRVNPFPYLISMVFASNIGGTATLIGDPPNILIGSAADLSFIDFLFNLAPVVTMILLAWIGMMRRDLLPPHGRRRRPPRPARPGGSRQGDPGPAADDPLAWSSSARRSSGSCCTRALGLEVATIAMLGATVLMLVGGIKPHEAFEDVEWNTLFFFVGLFILVEAIVQVGIISGIADAVADAVAGRQGVATIGILWFSAIVSAVVDNIPYTATAIPIVQRLAEGGLEAQPMWWALSLGACLGGNMTIVGASANVVVANMAAREGHAITFWQFLRYGTAVVVVVRW